MFLILLWMMRFLDLRVALTSATNILWSLDFWKSFASQMFVLSIILSVFAKPWFMLKAQSS